MFLHQQRTLVFISRPSFSHKMPKWDFMTLSKKFLTLGLKTSMRNFSPEGNYFTKSSNQGNVMGVLHQP